MGLIDSWLSGHPRDGGPSSFVPYPYGVVYLLQSLICKERCLNKAFFTTSSIEDAEIESNRCSGNSENVFLIQLNTLKHIVLCF